MYSHTITQYMYINALLHVFYMTVPLSSMYTDILCVIYIFYMYSE